MSASRAKIIGASQAVTGLGLLAAAFLKVTGVIGPLLGSSLILALFVTACAVTIIAFLGARHAPRPPNSPLRNPVAERRARRTEQGRDNL